MSSPWLVSEGSARKANRSGRVRRLIAELCSERAPAPRGGGGVRRSPDGARVVTASDDRTARLWDAAAGAPIGLPLRHERVVRSVAFSPDWKRVLTASNDDTARLWDVGWPEGPITAVACALPPQGTAAPG
ncbi:MAG TPA: hypothetical protein VEX11_00160 [Acetobacteraceae bacterium]|nr:hypothetical protein [Acetobacteraceae bacterium]